MGNARGLYMLQAVIIVYLLGSKEDIFSEIADFQTPRMVRKDYAYLSTYVHLDVLMLHIFCFIQLAICKRM